jgi:hypothetical protein
MPCDTETDSGLSAFNRYSTKMDEYLIREKGIWKNTQDVNVTDIGLDKCY